MDYELNDSFTNLFTAIGRLEGKLDSLSVAIEEANRSALLLEARVRKLEQFRSWLLGMAFAGGAAGSAIVNSFFLN